MSDYVIRRARATLADAAGLLAVEHASLGDSDYTPRQALAVLQRPEQRVHLALAGAEVVGFCGCFITRSPAGVQLEVDLLGVLAEHRGRFLARRMIAAARQEALAEGIHACRAVVEAGNAASLAAFRAAGMESVGALHALLVYLLQGWHRASFLPHSWATSLAPPRLPGWSEHTLYDAEAQLAARAGCIEAHTLSYRGLWLEQVQARNPEALTVLARALVEHAKRRRLDEVGFLCPWPEENPDRQVLAVSGWRAMGAYYVLRETAAKAATGAGT